METQFNQRFDTRRNFQYVNDEPSVLHCHHYITLFTKLAMEHESLGGTRFLSDSMEESIFLVLKKYFIRYKLSDKPSMIKAAEEYFALMGMGLLSITLSGKEGSAVLKRSHVDEGWIDKWGKTDKPVNFVGCGYLAAAAAVVNDLPIGSYEVSESSSIAKGDSNSNFFIKLRK